MGKFFRIFSWLSIIAFLGFLSLLVKELLNGLSFTEIDSEPIVVGTVLIINSIISLLILSKKIAPNITFLIVQISIIAYCLYLIYYYSFNTFPLIIDSSISH